MNKELEQFQADLLQSVREMKAGKVARVTQVEVSAVASTRARHKTGSKAAATLPAQPKPC